MLFWFSLPAWQDGRLHSDSFLITFLKQNWKDLVDCAVTDSVHRREAVWFQGRSGALVTTLSGRGFSSTQRGQEMVYRQYILSVTESYPNLDQ